MASKSLDRMVADPNCPIEDYDDERDMGNGYLVYLYSHFQWEPHDDASVRSFDTISEVKASLSQVVKRNEPHPDDAPRPG